MAGVGRINAVGLLYNSFIYSRMKEITYIFSGSQGFSDEGRTDSNMGEFATCTFGVTVTYLQRIPDGDKRVSYFLRRYVPIRTIGQIPSNCQIL